MLACVDVDYRDSFAVAACVLLRNWESRHPEAEMTELVQPVAPYEPGAFYKRELPCLLAVLSLVRVPLEAILVDAYVDLAPGRPGLGRHLFESLHVPVIGVAKTRFAGATHAMEVHRGVSRLPLYVTTAGYDPETAREGVRRMTGDHRIPDLLRRVDRLCRDAPGPTAPPR
jgi:deoxyribonuclease V